MFMPVFTQKIVSFLIRSELQFSFFQVVRVSECFLRPFNTTGGEVCGDRGALSGPRFMLMPYPKRRFSFWLFYYATVYGAFHTQYCSL